MSNIFTKEQLLMMDDATLREIAVMANPSTVHLADRDSLIYAILDAQAESLSTASEKPHRRPRITKRSSDHVYLATKTGESERFDTAKEERALKRTLAAKERAAELEATQALLGVEGGTEPPKRKRGRPTKAEKAMAERKEEEEKRREALMQQAIEAMELPAEEVSLEMMPQAVETAPDEVVEQPAKGALVEGKEQDDELASIEKAENEEHASSEEVQDFTTEPTDEPDFIVAQMKDVTVEPTELLDTDLLDSLPTTLGSLSPSPTSQDQVDGDEQEVAAPLPEMSVMEEKTPTPQQLEKWQQLQEAIRGGADFIICQDVPVVEQVDFALSPALSSPEGGGTMSHSLMENDPLARFRQFNTEQVAMGKSNERETKPERTKPSEPELLIDVVGVLELDNQNGGFLRSADYNYMPSPDDVSLPAAMLRQYSLKMGDTVAGKARVPRGGEKYYVLTSIEQVNGWEPAALRDRVAFEHLTPLFPDEQYKLSDKGNAPLSCRIVDLFAPIGKGQRALIVAQPKTGKTILMKQIANAISANYPEAYLMMLLIDERPEEVTDMARTVNAEVISSTFDEPAARHVRIAQMVLEKAKRMVECGHDVVIFLDSITRLARAFNTTAPTSGKILTGGVDANALQKPKRFFGAARNIEGGGSLTIIATALIDTGSRMDEVIFEEFKGTGNMELQLDRTLANKRIFPAVNLTQSSTRRDDLLHDETTLQRMHIVRNYMADMNSIEAMTFLQKRLEYTRSNEEFIKTMER